MSALSAKTVKREKKCHTNFPLGPGEFLLRRGWCFHSFLGVYLDRKMTWSEHLIDFCRRLPKVIFLIRSLSKFVSLNTLLTAYHVCCLFLRSFNMGLSLDFRCIRVIAGLKYRDCSREIFVNPKQAGQFYF